ncbi:MAG: Spi family protease inhibitor, partial [Bacteroidales bacterium]|nr:Spi family protease inhibitor [Bacteroidales bacterium]
MKKFYLTLCLLAVGFSSLMAGPVDQQKAQKLGAKFLSTTALAQRNADIQLNCVAAATDITRGAIDYYVFNVKNGEGFIIVSGDDCAKPILAYSTTGTYDPQDVSEGFAFTLKGF